MRIDSSRRDNQLLLHVSHTKQTLGKKIQTSSQWHFVKVVGKPGMIPDLLAASSANFGPVGNIKAS